MLSNIGDEMVIRKTRKKGITISKVHGDMDIPLDNKKNVAAISAASLINKISINYGFDGESSTGRTTYFLNGLINNTESNSDSWSRRMRSYRFNFYNEYNGAVYDQHLFQLGTNHENIRTFNHSPDFVIYGPGTIKFYPSVGHLTWIDNPSYIQLSTDITGLDIRVTYVVETVGSDSDDDQSKFSVSLDDDGDRVAVGYKEEGSEAVVRVYEYSNGSWEQLGDDVE